MAKTKFDPFKNLKHIGYCMSQWNVAGLDDLVTYARFQLCLKTKTLMKDPIWDTYTKEEILAEFYAHQFTTNKEFLKQFELELNIADGVVDDFADWADKQIAKEAEIRAKTLESMEEKVSFNPADSVMGED